MRLDCDDTAVWGGFELFAQKTPRPGRRLSRSPCQRQVRSNL